MDSSFELQNNVRNQVEILKKNLQDQSDWEKEMKHKESALKKQQEVSNKKMPPVRSRQSEMHDYEQRLENLKVRDNKDTEEEKVAPPEEILKTLDIFDVKLDADVFKEKGNQQVKACQYELAIEFYSKAIQVYNKDPVYFCNRSLCYIKLGKWKECVDDCNQTILLDPKRDKPYYRRMQAYEALGEDILALKDCQKVIEFQPKTLKFKTDYDRIHNNIKRKENELEKQKVKWMKSKTATQISFVDKAPHLRSKKPMVRVPIKSTEKRVQEHIPESVIDRLFNNNTGENLPLPKSERKPVSFSFNQPKLTNPPTKKDSPPKIIKQDVKPPIISTTVIAAKIEDKAEKLADKIIADQEAEEARKKVLADKVLPNFEDLQPLTKNLLVVPKCGPEFYSSWKELVEEKRFLYLKAMVEAKSDVGVVLGSTLDSAILQELINIVLKYFVHYNVPYLGLLESLTKNREMKILSLFLDKETLNSIRKLLVDAGEVDAETKKTIEVGFRLV